MKFSSDTYFKYGSVFQTRMMYTFLKKSQKNDFSHVSNCCLNEATSKFVCQMYFRYRKHSV